MEGMTGKAGDDDYSRTGSAPYRNRGAVRYRHTLQKMISDERAGLDHTILVITKKEREAGVHASK